MHSGISRDVRKYLCALALKIYRQLAQEVAHAKEIIWRGRYTWLNAVDVVVAVVQGIIGGTGQSQQIVLAKQYVYISKCEIIRRASAYKNINYVLSTESLMGIILLQIIMASRFMA